MDLISVNKPHSLKTPHQQFKKQQFFLSGNTWTIEQKQLLYFEDFFYENPLLVLEDITDPYFDFTLNTDPSIFNVRRSSITTFFSTNLIDMPICFNKSKSLYMKSFQIPLLKFTNLIMRKGFQNRTLKIITGGFNSLTNNLPSQQGNNLTNWIFLSKNFSSFWVESKKYHNLTFKPETSLKLNKQVRLGNDNFKPLNVTQIFNDFLIILEDYLPTFGFFIRKVNKDLRKNSRGRSGKYTIVWKYVPVYKRLYLTMRWFLKDLKFQSHRVINNRFYHLIETLFLTPELSFVFKARRFVHHYVFKNFKKTLLNTLKSV